MKIKTVNMIMCTLCLLFPLIGNSAGVVEKGIKAGVNVSTFWASDAALGPKDDLNHPSFKFNMTIGGYFIYDFEKKLALQPEFYFLQTGAIYTSRIDGQTLKTTKTLSYISLPILATYPLRENVNLMIGPYFNFIINGKEKTELAKYSTTNIKINRNEYTSPDIGIILGGSYQYPLKNENYIIFEGRMALGMRSIDQNDAVDVKNLGLIFLLGYAF